MIARSIVIFVCLCNLVFDQSSQAQQVELRAQHYYVLSVAYAPEGKQIAYSGTDPRIIIAEASSGKTIRELSGHENTVAALAFEPKGRILASASTDGTVKLWDWTTGKLLRSLGSPGQPVFALAFNAAGDKIADIRSGSLVTVWNVSNGTLAFQRQLNFKSLTSVLFSLDGNRLFVAGEQVNDSGALEIWDIPTQSSHRHKAFETRVTALASATPNSLFIGNARGEVMLYDVNADRVEKSWRAHTVPIRDLELSSDRRMLATVVSWNTPDVRIWLVSNTQTELHSFVDDVDGATAVSFSPDSRELAVIGRDNKIRFWDVAGGKQLRIIVPAERSRGGRGNP